MNEFIKMMAPQTRTRTRTRTLLLLLLCSSLLVGLCVAKPYCPPSSCGIIPNIRSPFRLQTDPAYCGDRRAKLVCENNVTFLYRKSHKFYVKLINYTTLGPVIRLVDASTNSTTCSFLTSSAYLSAFLNGIYQSYHTLSISSINFLSCPYPLQNSYLFTNFTYCQISNSSSSRFIYIKIGKMMASEVPKGCRIDVTVSTSWEFKDWKNVSLEEIHHSFLYGFDVRLSLGYVIPDTRWDRFIIFFYWTLRRPFKIILVILVVSGVIVNPIMAMVAAAIILVFLLSIAVGIPSAIRYKMPIFLIETFAGFVPYDNWNVGWIANIMIIVGPRFIISLFIVWVLICKFRRRHMSRFDTIEKFLKSDNKLVPIRYFYSDIRKMTKNFRDKLGEGGYGSVYKGKLCCGHYVAVKLLEKSGTNDQDFMNEIATIGRIHHVNIVTLVGYCAEGSRRALVFDFMPNGSLEKYIFNREKMNDLNWDMKFGIVIGVARGIQYLHRGCDIQILHFDIKPHNILLDDKFIPKISDFGLAKFFSKEKHTLTITAARGTIGYVAPELINRGIGRVSHKADVYSFGMLLMEMAGLNRDLEGNNDDSSKYFPGWIYDHFNQDKDIKIESVDENDDESTRILVRKITIVALWCIQINPDNRPSMNKVLEMLEGEVERLEIPHNSSVSLHENETRGANSTYSDFVSLHHYNDAPDVEITFEDCDSTH